MLRIDKRELPEYQYEDAVVRDAYNIAARELEQQALVRLEWARKQSVLSCIVLDLERVAQCYECADRVHPRKKAEEVANIIMQKLADNPVPWIAAWRDAVCAQVRNSMKVPTYCRGNAVCCRSFCSRFNDMRAVRQCDDACIQQPVFSRYQVF